MSKHQLTPDQVDDLILEGEYVHTFVQSGSAVLIGADWKRSEILEAARAHGAELAGETATAMQHGVCVWNRKEPVFVQTKKEGAK